MLRSVTFSCIVALLCTTFPATNGKKGEEEQTPQPERFEPCDYCYALFELQETSGDLTIHWTRDTTSGKPPTPLDLCEKFQGKAKEQCMDFATAYAPVWLAQMSQGYDFAAEFCQEILVCKATRFHRPFYTSQGFCHKCKEVASVGLIVAKDVPEDALKDAISVFMCKTLKMEGFKDKRCINDMLKEMHQISEESLMKELKPARICKMFGTCEAYDKWYPSRPSTGYFHEVSIAERKKIKEVPRGPHAHEMRERKISIPEIPRAKYRETHYVKTRAGYSLPMFKKGEFPHWYKPLIPPPSKPQTPKTRKRAKPKKIIHRKTKRGQGKHKKAASVLSPSPSAIIVQLPETLPPIEVQTEPVVSPVPIPEQAPPSVIASPIEQETEELISAEPPKEVEPKEIVEILEPPKEEVEPKEIVEILEPPKEVEPKEIVEILEPPKEVEPEKIPESPEPPLFPAFVSEPSQISPEKESGEHELEHDNHDSPLEEEDVVTISRYAERDGSWEHEFHKFLIFRSGPVKKSDLIPLKPTKQRRSAEWNSDAIQTGGFTRKKEEGLDTTEVITTTGLIGIPKIEA